MNAHRPDRLRSAGTAAWSLVGLAVLALTGLLLVLVLRSMILALVTALFLAIVFAPLVDALDRRGLPRPAGAAVALLLVMAVAGVAAFLVIAGVASQQEQIGRSLAVAVTRLQSLFSSAGMSATAAGSAEESVRDSVPTAVAGLWPALGSLFGAVANVAIGVFVALFTCFFLLKDGRSLAGRTAAWLPLP